MGVKAVVAAGWAVDDRIAEVFAKTFYQAMLGEGALFGDAVKQARRAAYNCDPTDNTWGAYQCYGDPSYRLMKSGRSRSNKARGWRWNFVSINEAIVELQNIKSNALASRDQKIADKMRVKIEGIADYADSKGWGSNTEFLSAVGLAYGEIGHYASAITYLKSALDEPRRELTYKVEDELANYKARLAVEVAVDDPDSANTLIQEAIDYLVGQIQVRLKEPAIYNYLGSTYRRKVVVDKTHTTKRESLKQMRDYHKKATLLERTSSYVAPYGGLQWATAELLHYWLSPRRELQAGIKALLVDVESTIDRALDGQNLSFWDINEPADLQTVRLLLPDNIDDETMPEYRFDVGSKRQCESILGSFDFVIGVLEQCTRKNSDAVLAKMTAIRTKLESTR